MKISTTRHIDGEKLEVLAEDVKSKKEAWEIIWKFKDDKLGKLKVESYDRILKISDEKLAIDFGDYSTFILVESDGSASDARAIQTFWSSEK